MRKKIILPEQEIARRLIETDATIRSLASEYGCSIQPICAAYRKHTTRKQRLERKHEKQAAKMRGRENPQFKEWRQTHNVWTGRKHTKASRKKMRGKRGKVGMEIRIAASARMQGVPVSKWSGFKTSKMQRDCTTREYKDWRTSVFRRDKFTCQQCRNSKSKPIHAHHIKPKSQFPELMYEISNGITLCIKCHKETDSFGSSRVVASRKSIRE